MTKSSSSTTKRRESRAISSDNSSTISSTNVTSQDGINDNKSVKTIHDPRVPNILEDNDIHFTYTNKHAARNKADLERRLAMPRGSMSPSQGYDLEAKYDEFVAAVESSNNEETVSVVAVIPYLLKPEWRTEYQLNTALSDLAPITDRSIPATKPEIQWGADRADLAKPAREACAPHIVPNQKRLILVNHTCETKGKSDSAAVARTQIQYNGAIGARGMDKLRYFAKPVPSTLDTVARTHGTTFSNGTVVAYATHSERSGNGNDRAYYTERIAGEYALGSSSQFRAAASLVRNQRDVALEDRRVAIEDANHRCQYLATPPFVECNVDEESASDGNAQT